MKCRERSALPKGGMFLLATSKDERFSIIGFKDASWNPDVVADEQSAVDADTLTPENGLRFQGTLQELIDAGWVLD